MLISGPCGREQQDNPNSAGSQCGCIITFASVLLIWKSQLISEICLSTPHAQCVGLSMAARALIPSRSLVESAMIFHCPSVWSTGITCEVFKENQGACLSATNQRLTTRSRCFNAKFHFFWSGVCKKRGDPKGWLRIIECAMDKQNADCLIKGLAQFVFKANRK